MEKVDRSGEKIFSYGKYNVKKYKHLCKDCDVEIWLNPYEEKTGKGYCAKCIYKYKTKSKKGIIFNEKGEKWCKACLRFLQISKFTKRGNGTLFSTLCSKCHNMKKFGINSLYYEKMMEDQKGLCAICNNPEKAFDKVKGGIRNLAVDHCHETGKVRALLCTKCNVSIGHFRNDPLLLQSAIDYLNYHVV